MKIIQQMPEVDDIALLREYVDRNSESAFAALVERRINLVYSVALRFIGNSEDAQDVTQVVFIILARKAPGLRPKTILTGWLYETTRFTAMNYLTRKRRRLAREQQAYLQSAVDEAEAASIWPQLAPLLESALSRLNERERTLVALRFFENRSMAEVAALLGVKEEAAWKRSARILEKLRVYFSKRGVDSNADSIAGAISINSIQAAPPVLAKAATAAALAKGTTASISITTLIQGALKIMAWTKTKTVIVAGAGVLLALGLTELFLNHEHTVHLRRVSGAWEGTLRDSSYTGRVVLRIRKDNGQYHAVVDEIDSGNKNLPATRLSIGETSVFFESGAAFSYQGGLNSDATEITGQWNWTGQKAFTPLTLKRTATPDVVQGPLTDADLAPRQNADLQGVWKGAVMLPRTGNSRMYFKIVKNPDGGYRAELNSIDQPPIRPIPSTSFHYDRPDINIQFGGIAGSFEGQLDTAGSSIVGKWAQGYPLTLVRVDPSDETETLEAGKNYEHTSVSELQGHWSGDLPGTYGLRLHLVFNIAQMADGSFSATLDSPDQQLMGMPFAKVKSLSATVRLEMNGGSYYEGRLQNGKLAGVWNFKSRDKMISEPIALERLN